MASISDHGKAATVYPATHVEYLREDEVGHFTSACGICKYTGGLFEGKYSTASFVCEPVSNLVHADILTVNGATFSAGRAEVEKEFLASTDSWFRPVNLTVGPEGGLYVVDFYRKLVEHPDWIGLADSSGFYTHAGQLKESDFLEGNDRGRIYRVVPKSYKAGNQKKNRLSEANTQTLVRYLNDQNSWWRINAQRLLIDQKDPAAIPLIKDYLLKNGGELGKIHALWTLEGLQSLDDSMLGKAMNDADAAVRKQAVLLAEKRMDNRMVFQDILDAASDTDPHVQFQVALTLGTTTKAGPETFKALSEIIHEHIEDPWFRIAVLLGASANSNRWWAAYKDFEAGTDTLKAGKKDFLRKAASITGTRCKSDEISALVKMIAAEKDTAVIIPSLKGMTEGMKSNAQRTGLVPDGQQALIALINTSPPDVKKAAIEMALELNLYPSAGLKSLIDQSGKTAEDDKALVGNRVLAIKILGLNPNGLPFLLLGEMIGPHPPAEIQLAAAEGLLRSKEPAATEVLLKNWEIMSPRVHAATETAFLSNKEHLVTLMKAIESGNINEERISRDMQNRLTRHSDSSISTTAKKLFPHSGDREKVIVAYNESTTVVGDPAEGKSVFIASCSMCHALEGTGVNFGPDLQSLSHQTRIKLLTMILHPNNDIAAGYEGYVIETTDGNMLTGIISNESEQSLLLRMPGGMEQTIMKINIKSISAIPISLMPEGLESSISKVAMSNLLEYIKTLR